MVRIAQCTAVVLLLCAAAGAQVEVERLLEIEPRHYIAYRARGDIEVDGQLAEPSWQWADWTEYELNKIAEWLSVNEKNEDLETCPWVQRWRRQIATPYHKLSEKEKDSDRELARKAVESLVTKP